MEVLKKRDLSNKIVRALVANSVKSFMKSYVESEHLRGEITDQEIDEAVEEFITDLYSNPVAPPPHREKQP